MKLSKIINKISKYFDKDRLKKSHHEKIINLIEDLKDKRIKIKKELKELKKSENEKRANLNKKLFAINSITKKAKKSLEDR